MRDVQKLRERFVDSKSDGYIFAKQKHDYNLPISDLPELSEKSWISITTNHKLNLPNEKEQLAAFRCSTISTEIEEEFENTLKDLEKNNLIGNYGEIKENAIKKYEQETYHYGKSIVKEKKEGLINYIDDHLKKTVAEKLRIE